MGNQVTATTGTNQSTQYLGPRSILKTKEMVNRLTNENYSNFPIPEESQIDDLKSDMALVEQSLTPASPKELSRIVARLATLPSASVMKLSNAEAQMSLHDQVEALADLPADLAELARKRAMRHCRYAPSPVEIIGQVRDEIRERLTTRHILRMLIRKAGEVS